MLQFGALKYHFTCVVILSKSLTCSLTRASLVPVLICGEYYNLSADRMCAWPASVLGEAKVIVTISWQGSNLGNSAL